MIHVSSYTVASFLEAFRGIREGVPAPYISVRGPGGTIEERDT